MLNPIAHPALQITGRWHRDGMAMGLHWGWWVFWTGTFLVLLWGGWRLLADRSETRTRTRRSEGAEEELRRRFAEGDIDEEEFRRRLRILRENLSE